MFGEKHAQLGFADKGAKHEGCFGLGPMGPVPKGPWARALGPNGPLGPWVRALGPDT